MHARQRTALEFIVELTATGVLAVAGYSLTFQLLQALAVQNHWTQSKHGGALLDRFSSGARKIYCKFTSRALHRNLKNLLFGLHVVRSNGPVMKNLDPPLWIPPVQIFRNIWTPGTSYFRNIWTPSEIVGPPSCRSIYRLSYPD